MSAANYEARAFGIRAGMMIADAKSRCPSLLVVPYEFEKYEEASLQVTMGCCESLQCQFTAQARQHSEHGLCMPEGLCCKAITCEVAFWRL